jgi:hypothetical protein
MPPVSAAPAMPIGLGDVQQMAMSATSGVTRRVGEELAEPGTREAGQSLLWGIIGVTVCPLLVPSIMAIVYGNQARAKSVGLGGQSTKGAWGRALGWIGVGFWALVAVLAIIGAFTSN